MTVACVLVGGPDYSISAGGVIYRFEMHPYFGPAVLTKRGGIAEAQPGPNSPFWHAVTQWNKQGQRVGEDGLCVWYQEPKPITRHLGGRHYLIIGEEEPEVGR